LLLVGLDPDLRPDRAPFSCGAAALVFPLPITDYASFTHGVVTLHPAAKAG
jgi:hypothetical protein